MSDERVCVTIDSNGVAEVVLNRPAKMNALDDAMFVGLQAALERLHRQPALRAVVLHGEGRAFCAGLDLASFQRLAGPGLDGPLADLLTRRDGPANAAQQVVWGWRRLPVPVLAAVHGVAFGGGLQIALGADLRLLHPQARMSVMELRWGLVPDMGGIALLTELLRPDHARELVYTAKVVDAAEAVSLGLATRLSEDPLAEARALAAEIASRSPQAVRAAKRLFNGASPVNAEAVLMAESLEQLRLIGSPEQVAAVRAAAGGRA